METKTYQVQQNGFVAGVYWAKGEKIKLDATAAKYPLMTGLIACIDAPATKPLKGKAKAATGNK